MSWNVDMKVVVCRFAVVDYVMDFKIYSTICRIKENTHNNYKDLQYRNLNLNYY